jgi:triacylglycerol lipase
MTTLILDGIWGGHSRWEKLRRRIEGTLGTCHIWRYDNSGATSLTDLGELLQIHLKEIDGPINLVGYSMGGLVIREAVRRNPDVDVRRAALLHSPHHGSLTAWAFPLPACREMRPGSPFLKTLNAADWKIPTLATWCLGDAVILPGFSARWKQAHHILHSPMPAHAWPVISPAIHAAVVHFLKG